MILEKKRNNISSRNYSPDMKWGRVLAVLGVPVGPKADQRLTLSAYLADAPDETRE